MNHFLLSQNPLYTLSLDERAIRMRKANIARFGAGWLRPPGIPKTLQGLADERTEREEVEAARQREIAAAEAEAEAEAEEELRRQRGEGEESEAAQDGEREDEDGMGVDLDEDIPDADGVDAAGGEEGGRAAAEMGERDLDDDVPDAEDDEDDDEGDVWDSDDFVEEEEDQTSAEVDDDDVEFDESRPAALPPRRIRHTQANRQPPNPTVTPLRSRTMVADDRDVTISNHPFTPTPDRTPQRFRVNPFQTTHIREGDGDYGPDDEDSHLPLQSSPIPRAAAIRRGHPMNARNGNNDTPDTNDLRINPATAQLRQNGLGGLVATTNRAGNVIRHNAAATPTAASTTITASEAATVDAEMNMTMDITMDMDDAIPEGSYEHTDTEAEDMSSFLSTGLESSAIEGVVGGGGILGNGSVFGGGGSSAAAATVYTGGRNGMRESGGRRSSGGMSNSSTSATVGTRTRVNAAAPTMPAPASAVGHRFTRSTAGRVAERRRAAEWEN